jgi:hypothetical protein
MGNDNNNNDNNNQQQQQQQQQQQHQTTRHLTHSPPQLHPQPLSTRPGILTSATKAALNG